MLTRAVRNALGTSRTLANIMEPHSFKSADQNAQFVSAFWFVVLFAAISYVALSTRAILSPFEIKQFIDPKRILSVLAGAWILSMAISVATAAQDRGPRDQILAVLKVSLPGAIGILVIREIYDLATLGNLAQRLDLNARWMLTWIGYFAAAVATFFALSYYQQLKAARATSELASVQVVPKSAVDNQTEITDVLRVLQQPTGYETADVDFGPEALALQERRLQIDRLLALLAVTKPG